MLCERHKVRDVAVANRILQEELIPFYNEQHVHAETGEIPEVRWQRALQEERSKLRALPPDRDLDVVFSLQYRRSVNPEGKIAFDGQQWKSGALPGTHVTVCLHPDRKLIISQNGAKLWEHEL